jgi:hypothetical protein
MKIERLILIPFFGNYIINNVVAALAAMVPESQTQTQTQISSVIDVIGIILHNQQYDTYIVLSAIAAAIFAWWFFRNMPHLMLIKWGVIFGIVAFVVSAATAFVSGIAGTILQTGSFAQAMAVVPRFGSFLWNWLTLIVLGYWLIPAILVAWFMGKRMPSTASSSM